MKAAARDRDASPLHISRDLVTKLQFANANLEALASSNLREVGAFPIGNKAPTLSPEQIVQHVKF